ncbi:MAG: hypothetical protein IPN74_05475 [Haliscomenobacter sp.]|nr:hypothetical protein [Haliscomenobacter sp.]
MMHLIGHFLRDAIIGKDQPGYDFLSGNCRGQEVVWTHRVEEEKDLFDPARYISFQEAGADFFAYLMMRFILTREPEFVNKSLYFHPGYLQEFETGDKARTIKDKFPAYAVPGVQTSYWVTYYGAACTEVPARVFADFLLTQWWFTQQTENGEPASTFQEWLHARAFTPQTEFLIPGPDPRDDAQTWGLIPARQARLVPASPKADAEADINGRSVRNFLQIPAVYLDTGKVIHIARTAFELLLPGSEEFKRIRLEPGAQLRLGTDFEPNLASGAFRFRSAVDFRTPLATCQAKSTDFLVRLEEEETLFETYNGSLSLKSEKDVEDVMAGEGTSVNKRGRIKKATQLKQLPPPVQPIKHRHPFQLDGILHEVPQGYRK